ncbi:AAA domain-containing protein [Paenibacillus wynnii]|uniref:AAA domain-containing protein n=1 Tax=Paenibacillus wynnii TaxID=268407 RepID=UPI00278D4CE5|nr:AAA domain-containing protein [Paenibacillus wynnii]MDQ0194925.1 very-short-patch-repair endonuclease [Paenibacillus wynnii]
MQDFLKKFQDRLTDLTAKNASLRLMKLHKKNHFDGFHFTNSPDNQGFMILDRLQEERIFLMPVSSIDDMWSNHSRSLTSLKREIDLIEQETGANVFHVAYGFLEGYVNPDFYIRSPILLYPAKLVRLKVRNSLHWALEWEEEEVPFFNHSLQLALRRFCNVDLSQLSTELETCKPRELLDKIISFLEENRVSIKWDNDTKILPFPDMRKDDIPKYGSGFVLKPFMVMGKFRQSTSPLLQDYDHLMQNPPNEGILSTMLGGNANESDLEEVDNEVLNLVHEKETFFVLDTDASQEAAVVASQNRQGLIVHGPPGTGKSQVIANLVADRLARGQKVLVVCQKPVALEVVYNRLSSLNLNRHAALLRDSMKDRNTAYATLLSIFENSTLLGNGNEHEQISDEMYTLATKLNAVASSLHQERPFGRTLHQVYSKAIWDDRLIMSVKDLISSVTYTNLQRRKVELETIIELMEKYDRNDYPWSNRKSFASFSTDHQYELHTLLTNIIDNINKAHDIQAREKFATVPEDHVKHLSILKKLHKEMPSYNIKVAMYWKQEKPDFRAVRNTFSELDRMIRTWATDNMPVQGYSVEEARLMVEKIKIYRFYQTKWTRVFSTKWRRTHREVEAVASERGISPMTLQSQLDLYLSMEEVKQKAIHHSVLEDIPLSVNVQDWETWRLEKQQAIEFLSAYLETSERFPQWVTPITNSSFKDEFENKLNSAIQLGELTASLISALEILNKYLGEKEIINISKDFKMGTMSVSLFNEMVKTLEQFDSMCRLDQLKAETDDLNTKLLQRCKDKMPSQEDSWINLIENSFLHAWLLQIEEQEPHVKDVSTEIFERNRSRYIKLHKEKRKAVPGWINQRLGVKANEIGISAKSNLKREAQKKRKQLTLRQIFSAYSDDMLKLIPCWLCTPETVSTIFPMTSGLFDLVVFDEASQCSVENAIPTLYRAKQVVVAGDEKQLPPSDYFKNSSEEEEGEEEEAALQERADKAQSLLEWSKLYFADIWLTWHYRSQNDALINFSNYAFYGCRMEIAPSAHRPEGRPISFHQVEGKWVNNQNRKEAEMIVELVIDTLKNDESRPTIGIITFNSPQTDAIYEVLEEEGRKDPEVQVLIEEAKSRRNGDEYVGLFVKNIDNVQGDERDIIFFSVAYAKNEEGRMVSNFGPLSQGAGENRLNVAVTRAKKKIHIICSFDPREWNRAETYASGVRLFKRYLEYGKAVSDGDQEQVRRILNGLLDGNAVNGRSDLVFDSPFEYEVYEGLLDLDYSVDTQVGLSGYRIDLGIIHPNNNERYILGVECDGAMFHSSKVARERDYYRQKFLESHGWTIHRIWSRNWWKNRSGELDKVRQHVEKLKVKS